MKKVLIILIIILAVLALAYYMTSKPQEESAQVPQENNTGETFRPDPSNATFIFDDGSITLSSGRNERAVAPGSAFVEETVILDEFAYGDLNGDDKTDTALLLARYGSGSGTFIYAAVFASGPVNYRGSKAIYIGDRISPQSISVNGETVTVNYLDRELDEPFAAEPTVPMSKQFVLKDGEFQEK